MDPETITSCWCGKPHYIRHGTGGGYQCHLKLRRQGHHGVDPCEECRGVRAAYAKAYRARDPERFRRSLAADACRDRALRRLARSHPTELRMLIAEERRKAGIDWFCSSFATAFLRPNRPHALDGEGRVRQN